MATKAFLKWAGGKFRLVPRILDVLPLTQGDRFVEPFAGSAAVFLNVEAGAYLVADVNADLVALYDALKQEGETFIHAARALFTPRNNTLERYLALRARFNASRDPKTRAALFVYLNRHCFNGLCRYNSKGAFNVPFGRYKAPGFPEDAMRAFARKATRATFLKADFRTVLDAARPGDVVYCDPPYLPLSPTASFTGYATDGFSLDDQRDLADRARALAQRGIPVVISNHDTPQARALYDGADLKTFTVARHISADGAKRKAAPELLAVFAPERSRGRRIETPYMTDQPKPARA